jgi:hypothetical protein
MFSGSNKSYCARSDAFAGGSDKVQGQVSAKNNIQGYRNAHAQINPLPCMFDPDNPAFNKSRYLFWLPESTS